MFLEVIMKGALSVRAVSVSISSRCFSNHCLDETPTSNGEAKLLHISKCADEALYLHTTSSYQRIRDM